MNGCSTCQTLKVSKPAVSPEIPRGASRNITQADTCTRSTRLPRSMIMPGANRLICSVRNLGTNKLCKRKQQNTRAKFSGIRPRANNAFHICIRVSKGFVKNRIVRRDFSYAYQARRNLRPGKQTYALTRKCSFVERGCKLTHGFGLNNTRLFTK
jgi:hypothetical protein